VALIVAAGLFALSLARHEPWTRAVLGAVSLAMAAIPEEFPIVLTLFLSVGAWRLAAHGMLVRRLASVETLGSTTVICTDKTGTLTRGDFALVRHVVLVASLSEGDFLEIAVLACERLPADAMERAIGMYAERYGVSPSAIAGPLGPRPRPRLRPHRQTHVPCVAFARCRYHLVVAVKGAVEGVLTHCRLDPETRKSALDMNERLARQGLRVLAVATKRTNRVSATRDRTNRT
jgi:P-type Ca2+ transporter type 2C